MNASNTRAADMEFVWMLHIHAIACPIGEDLFVIKVSLRAPSDSFLEYLTWKCDETYVILGLDHTD